MEAAKWGGTSLLTEGIPVADLGASEKGIKASVAFVERLLECSSLFLFHNKSQMFPLICKTKGPGKENWAIISFQFLPL